METRTFTNITNNVFTHKWDGVRYDFEPQESVKLEAPLAVHFAKHLTMTILNDSRGKNGNYTPTDITNTMNKILGIAKAANPVEAAEVKAETSEKAQDLAGMKKAELVEFAEENDIEIDATAKKADIKATIEAEFEGIE